VEYLSRDTQSGYRMMAPYDAPRRPLLERGIALQAGPDLAELRRQVAVRQRREELAAAEAARASTSEVSRWRLRRSGEREPLPDPQLRPVTWAVGCRRRRSDLEDAYAHRTLTAHAFVLNGASTAAAVCGYKPRVARVVGGAQMAQLAVAAFDVNPHCERCLVLLYQARWSSDTDPGAWPAVDAAAVDAAAVDAAAVDALGTSDVDYGAEAELETLTLAEAASDHDDLLEIEVRADEASEDYPPVAENGQPSGNGHQPLGYASEEFEVVAIPVGGDSYEQAPANEGTLDAHIEVGLDAEVELVGFELEPGSELEAGLEAEDLSTEAISELRDPIESLVEEGVEDVLVIVAAGKTAVVAGGLGRGADWAGSVLDIESEPLLRRVWGSQHIVRRENPEPQRICGPFWSRAVALVPVSDFACVIFGSAHSLHQADELLHEAAVLAAERFEHLDANVTVADEREVGIAVQRITEAADLSFEGALDHILNSTASVLGCAIGAGVARMGGRLALRSIDLDGADDVDPALLLGPGPLLIADRGPSVEDTVTSQPHAPSIVSRLRVPLNGTNVQGMLVLTHTARRPRGFTSQDLRLAEAIAPVAVLVLERAAFGEGLRALESHLDAAPATDRLTGLANEAAWEVALVSEADRLNRSGGSAAVAAVRLQGLQRIDERQGPLARDAALREAAELVRRISRSTDIAARVGDDEFRILLRDSGTHGGRRLATRIRRALRAAQATPDRSVPPLTISWANGGSRNQLLQASRVVGQRVRNRSRVVAEHSRNGNGRSR
jgi:diguanylate cyclase (GGDEF)-like protein